MQQSAGEPSSPRAGERFRGAILGLIAAFVPLAALWGFTVDDALVTARMAHHLATGAGYRFNLDGPVVDAVTPLGYAHVLSPFAAGGVIPAWQAARWLGAACWLATAAWLGVQVATGAESRWRWLALAPLATCAPVAAWAGAGMETGIVTALATLGAGRGRWSLALAGLAAAWRPELVPWAVVIAVGRAWTTDEWPRGLPRLLTLALGPAIVVAVLRVAYFGSPAPLAVWAKPSDLPHGLYYATGALLWTGLPALAIAPWSLRKTPHAAVLVAGFIAHLGAIALAGGDWMALFRLVVPVLPSLVLVGVWLSDHASSWSTITRAAVATAIGAAVLGIHGRAARGVAGNRLRLIAEASPMLAGAQRVAAVDVGWVGAATPAHVVDLAGITDPTIAALAGGHTTKRVGRDLLRHRDVDHIVLLLAPGASVRPDWETSDFAKGVGRRIAAQAASGEGFRVEGTLALGGTHQQYVVVTRRRVE